MFEIESISSSSLEDFITASFCYNILIIEDAVFSLNFKTYISSGKTMLLIGPNQIFSWISSAYQVIDIVKFDGEIYDNYFNEKCTLLQGILSDDKFYMINNQCIMEEVIHIIDRMKSFHIGKSETYDIGQLYLRLIISFIFNDGTAEVINCKYSDRKSVICFQNLVESFFSENKQVSFYAAKFGMPIYSFNRMVKRVLGVSPSKIIQERIILEAKRLLVLSDMSVKEIASELNFQDEFYFSRYFKKSVGLSPKYFRTTIQ